MRFEFRALPAAGGGTLTPRPVIDIALEGLADGPMQCLLDTGALRTPVSAELAPLAGIELARALTEDFYIGGLKTVGALARVNLTVTDGTDEFCWDAPVWFVTHGPTPSAWPGSRASCITSS
jgi:hypothetical protein